MKKIALLSVFLLTLFLFSFGPAQAKAEGYPPWFNSLIERVDALTQRVNDLDPGGVESFKIPAAEDIEVTYYHGIPNDCVTTEEKYMIKLSFPTNACQWNETTISSYTSARATIDLSPEFENQHGVGECHGEISFGLVDDLPTDTFPADIYFWWQGREEHLQVNLMVPSNLEEFPPPGNPCP